MSRLSLHVRHAWSQLGRTVNQALPCTSNLSPTSKQIAVAARKVGIPKSAARTALAVFLRDDPAPCNVPPVPSRQTSGQTSARCNLLATA